jgi:hypothetical protein
MNPVTRSLLRTIADPQLDVFVTDWDRLEILIVDIYKQKSVSFAQQEEYFHLKQRLEHSLPSVGAELAPFWAGRKILGEQVTADPFAALIAKASAKDFVGDWDAMRTLPAAREALNQMLVARIENRKL